MEEDIDIEEHDVMDNPRIRQMLPDLDLSHIKTEVPEDADAMTTEDIEDKPSTLLATSPQSFRQRLAFEEEVIRSPVNNKIILGSKPSTDSKSPILASLLGHQNSPNSSNHPSLIFGTNFHHTIKTESLYDYPESNLYNERNNFDMASNRNEFQGPRSVIVLGSKPNRPFNERNIVKHDVETAFVLLEDWGPRLHRSPCYCKECEILFPTRNCLDAHKMSAHSFLVALESKSPENFVQAHNTARKSTANEPGTSKSRFCNHCNKVFPDDNSLIKHLYEYLPFDKFKCDKCDAAFRQQEELDIHVRFQHYTAQEVDDDAGDDEDESEGYLVCHICGCHFVTQWRYDAHVTQKHFIKNVDTYSRQPFNGACPACNKMYDEQSINRLNKHIQESHRDLYHTKVKTVSPIPLSEHAIPKPKLLKKLNAPPGFLKKLSQEPQPPQQAGASAIFSYQCVKCKKLFTSYTAAHTHRNTIHPELRNQFLLKKIVGSKPGKAKKLKKIAAIPYGCIKDAPVPIQVLFKCDKCSIHFTSCSLAALHSKRCVKNEGEWECEKCALPFQLFDKITHQRQHIISDKFRIYVNTETLHGIVLCKCPDCKLYLHEQEFWTHTKHGCLFSKAFVACTHCTFRMHPSSVETHEQWHMELQMDKADLILVRYAKTKDGAVKIPRKKKMPAVAPEVSQPPRKNIKITPMTLYYCSTCKCCMKTLQNQNSHKTGECETYVGKKRCICKLCGLFVAQRQTHSNFHMLNPNVKLRDYKVINLRDGREMKPPMPVYPRCESCQVRFISKRALQRHECEDSYKTCKYCNAKFSDLAYKLHVPFHEYYVKKPAAQPAAKSAQLSKTKATYSKSAKTPAVPKKTPNMPELLKKYELLTKTWNILYLCKKCDLVTDSYDQTIEHSQNHHKGIEDNDKCMKKCHVCMLNFDEACFERHRHLHLTNESVNRSSFTILTYDYTVLLTDDWFKLFGKLPEKQTQQIVSHSIYSTHRSMKMRLIVDGPAEQTLYKCAQCSKYVNPFTMSEHHKNNECNKNPCKLYCKLCHIPFTTKAAHDLHFVAHEDESRKTFRSVLINEHQPKLKIRSKIKSQRKYHYYQCQKCQSCIFHLAKTKQHICSFERKKRCPKCNLIFASSSLFKHDNLHKTLPKFTSSNIHITPFNNRNEGKPKIYKCKCGLHFISLKTVKKHLSVCGSKSKISKETCSKCGLLFPTDVLVSHLCNHHRGKNPHKFKIEDVTQRAKLKPNPVYKCAKCNVCYMQPKSLKYHFDKNHLTMEPSECTICGLRFTSYSMKKHMVYHHGKFKCNAKNIGVKVLSNKPAELAYHQTKFISKAKDIGVKEVSNKSAEKRVPHQYGKIKLNSKDSIKEVANKPVESKAKVSKSIMKLNVKYYSNKLYKCTVCTKHFLGKTTLESHFSRRKVSHGQEQIDRYMKCDICHLNFGYNTLARHKHVHHDKMKLTLKDIDVISMYNPEKTLQKQENCKYNNYLYKCEKCRVHFLSENSLKCHLFKHSTIKKRVICEKCGFLFNMVTLTRHIYIHHTKLNLTRKDFIVTTSNFKRINPAEDPDADSEDACDELQMDDADEHKTEQIEEEYSDYEPENKNELSDPGQIETAEASPGNYKNNIDTIKSTSVSEELKTEENLNNMNYKTTNAVLNVAEPKMKSIAELETPEDLQNYIECETTETIQNVTKINSGDLTNVDSTKENDPTNKIYTDRFLYLCDVCSLAFVTFGSLQKHMSSKLHKYTKLHNCDLCDLPFFSLTALRKHEDQHHNELGLKFKDLVIIHSNKAGYQDVEKHNATIFRCNKCTQYYFAFAGFLEHIDYCDGHVLQSRKCSVCDLVFSNRLSRAVHNREHHEILKLERKDFRIISDSDFLTKEDVIGSEMIFANVEDKSSESVGTENQVQTSSSIDLIDYVNDTDDRCFTEQSNEGLEDVASSLNVEQNITIDVGNQLDLNTPNSSLNHLENSTSEEKSDNELSLQVHSNCLFKCLQCSTHFLKEHTLLLHRKKSYCSNGFKRNCTICGLQFSSVVLAKHKDIHHVKMKLSLEDMRIVECSIVAGTVCSNSLFKCSTCHLHFTRADSVWDHSCCVPGVSDDSSAIRCRQCGYAFSRHVLKSHKYLHHEQMNLKRADFQIILPNSKEQNASENVIDHEIAIDFERETRKLKKRPKVFKSKESIAEDISKFDHHLYKCSKCKVLFLVRNTLLRHVYRCGEVAKRAPVMECDVCGLSFTSFALTRHKYIQHEKLNLQKDDLVILDETQLNDYTDVSESTQDTDAGESASTVAEKDLNNGKPKRKLDKLPHNFNPRPYKYSNRLYKCNICSLHYINKSTASAHEHKPVYKISCQTCGLQFTQQSLIRHSYVHHQLRNLRLEDLQIINYQTGVVEKVTNTIHTFDDDNAETESGSSTLNTDDNSMANDNTAINEEPSTSGNATKRPKLKAYTLSTDSKRKINLKAYNNVIYKCDTCHLNFLNYARIKYHIFSCENVVVNKMECSVCGLSFAYITLAKHMYIHHSKMKLTKDDIRVIVLKAKKEDMPDIRANSLSIRDKKVNIQSSSEVVEILQPDSDVEIAPMVVDNIGVLNNLETLTMGDNEEVNTEASKSPMQVPNIESYDNKLYRCNICSVHFFKYIALESHVENDTHGILKKKCDLCKLEFTIVSLSIHVYVHHDYLKLNLEDFEITSLPPPRPNIKKAVKLYKCGECNVHFLTQATCYKHTTKHKKFDTKEFIECKLCGFQFRIISLHKHMLVHHAEDFKLDNVLVEEYHPNILKDGTPKLDIYYAKDKVQSRLVSTTCELSNVEPDTTVSEDISESTSVVDTESVHEIVSDVTGKDNRTVEPVNSGVVSEFVTNYSKPEEYTAANSKSNNSIDIVTEIISSENYGNNSGIVASISDNSKDIEQSDQMNASNSNDIDQINELSSRNSKNEESAASDSKSNDSNDIVTEISQNDDNEPGVVVNIADIATNSKNLVQTDQINAAKANDIDQINELLSRTSKNEEYTAANSKSNDNNDIVTETVSSENDDIESAVVANLTGIDTNSKDIEQTDQINAANSNDIDLINELSSRNSKNEEYTAANSKSNDSNDIVTGTVSFEYDDNESGVVANLTDIDTNSKDIEQNDQINAENSNNIDQISELSSRNSKNEEYTAADSKSNASNDSY